MGKVNGDRGHERCMFRSLLRESAMDWRKPGGVKLSVPVD